MSQAGFEPAIPTGEWPQIHTLDRAVTGRSTYMQAVIYYFLNHKKLEVLMRRTD
jgi:hypothetical protein